MYQGIKRVEACLNYRTGVGQGLFGLPYTDYSLHRNLLTVALLSAYLLPDQTK
jgi:hypothetical protein